MVNTLLEPRQDEVQVLVNRYQNDRNIQIMNKEIAEVHSLHTVPCFVFENGIIKSFGCRWVSVAGEKLYNKLRNELETYIKTHYSLIFTNYGN